MASTRGGGAYQPAVEPGPLFSAANRLKAIADELKNSHHHAAAQVKNVLGAERLTTVGRVRYRTVPILAVKVDFRSALWAVCPVFVPFLFAGTRQ